MTKFYSTYSLKKKSSGGVHQNSDGVLFKLIYPEGIGYSLYHPIISLGDRPIDSIIKLMKESKLKDQTCKKIIDAGLLISNFFNKEQQLLRANKNKRRRVQCYFSGGLLSEISNNIIEEEVLKSGFLKIKIKIDDIKALDIELFKKNNLKVILDFNQKGDSKELETFFETKVNRELIDYVEDPPKGFMKSANVFIASDFDQNLINPDYIINKPTGFEHSDLNLIKDKTSKLITTSYLDHPLGQLIAALSIDEKYLNLDHGVLTHRFFKKNKYSDLLDSKPVFDLSSDLGDDFEKLLSLEDWQRL